MRIAVPIDRGVLNPHFGSSRSFWIGDVTQDQDPPAVTNPRELAIPETGGCGVIPALLAQQNVELVIAGGIGGGAVANLERAGIQVVAGAPAGEPATLALAFAAGALVASGGICHEHARGQGHGHGHQHRHGQAGCCHGQGAR